MNSNDRFWAKVKKTPECWLWQGTGVGPVGNKYGQTYINGKPIRAHRVAYELLIGPIPDGLVIDHLCRTPLCVRPDHLEAVTHRENTMRGVGITAMNAIKDHCKRGHAFDGENTYKRLDGTRTCRACKRAQAVVRRAKRRGEI